MSKPEDNPTASGDIDWDKISITAADIAKFALDGDVVEHDLPTPVPVKAEIVGNEDDGLVLALRSLKTDLRIADDARIVSPGSSSNVAIARVFGKETTMHVDPDEQAIGVLTEHGYLGSASRIEDFTPDEPYDVMVATNSYGSPTQAVLDRVIKPGGLVITNNYTEWAREIAETTNARLIGAVLPSYTRPEATYRPAEELPEGVTDVVTNYYDARTMRPVSGPGPNIFGDEAARYPDALFVFKMPEAPSLPAAT